MKGIFIYLFFLPIFVCAEWDQFFTGNEDPAVVHQVNVITGNLNLSFQDMVAEGAQSIPLMRTYSSAGALESALEQTLLKGLRKGWIIQGGWNLLSHISLLLLPNINRKEYQAYLAEPGGNVIAYAYSHKQKGTKYTIFLKPDRSMSQTSGQLSARTNPQNNLLRLNLKTGEAILFLPDGGQRIYRGDRLHHYQNTDFIGRCFYLLDEEITPSKHRIHYSYDSEKNLQKIEALNPSGNKVYSSIAFEYTPEDKKRSFHLKAKTSDQKEVSYEAGRYKTYHNEKKDYLHAVHRSFRSVERFHLKCEREAIGARLTSFELEGNEQFKVRYYCPSDEKHEKKWAQEPDKKDFHIDKIESVSAFVDLDGKEVAIAQFVYSPGRTSVRDSDGLLTEYHHDGERLNAILYFDEKDRILSMQKFYWEDTHLCCKAVFDWDGEYHPLFAKTFSYVEDNVVEEVLWGNLTGDASNLQIDETLGKPSGAEYYRKTYTYYTDNHNLLKSIKEEGGPLYEYVYKPGTDLIAAKFTKSQEGRILIREFYFYNEDNLLVHEIIDDGASIEPNEVSQVTQRLQKYTERNSSSGLSEAIIESYWDPISQVQKLLRKTKLTHVNQRITEEAIYDAEDNYRYTIYTEYDDAGNVKRKTTPLGQENTYLYNGLGLQEQSKEVGSPRKFYGYDRANRRISCTEIETGKIALTSYDAKNRLFSQTDERGNLTAHSYDLFGNRIATTFPKAKNEQGSVYEPVVTFKSDSQGNLISSTMPLGETTRTSYNLFRKPTRIIQPDGTEILHRYYKNGALAKTIYPDGAEDQYTYDPFQRLISKIVYSSHHAILSLESWEYNAFQLQVHTDSRGLVTRFSYDGAGRKIAEEAGDRKTTYTYDPLGFLERTENNAIAFVKKHNSAGLISEQWEEDRLGHIENRMRFLYDVENRKKEAIRTTSQGEAIDRFDYKNEKLIRHTDPSGAITEFIYDENFINELGQKVLHQTTIDPLGNEAITTYDAAERIVSLEKRDPGKRTVFKEEFLYDASGNRAKRISHVYQEGKFCRQIAAFWQYDAMGRVIEELEADQKKTAYHYDSRQRLQVTTLPNGVQISSNFDALGRLLERRSSDRTIHDQYVYLQGSEPVQIIDRIRNNMIQRTYNQFGEIILEMSPLGFQTRWNYDSIGRCISMILPDNSSVEYPTAGAHMKAVQRITPDGRLLYEHRYSRFDPNGHIAEEQLIFNLGSLQTTHDLLERPTHQSSPWLEHSLEYGPSGLVTTTQNSLFGNKGYAHDALNQLTQDGKQTYLFDSLGNPASCEVNDLNQITATESWDLIYDANGNLQEKIGAQERIAYTFDPLGRLTEITYSEREKVSYFYDPLSRLFAKETYRYVDTKWETESKIFYLYDRDQEIGTVDDTGKVIELKILGLGIRGDIGAAIAMEIKGAVYAPLHDFNGSVIALLSSNGEIVETYEIDAFGTEKTSSPPRNTWRFCSKRTEEDLVFFGHRFYDPCLKRWLTPDPAGFTDGANLYAYVQNRPLNRLDLFGLFSEDFSQISRIEFNIPIPLLPFDHSLFRCRVLECGVYTDYLVSCGYWHQLQFTPHEQESGSFNLFDHSELLSRDGRISLVTSRHGINTTFSEFSKACESITKKLPGTLFIGRYHGTEGIGDDILASSLELCNVETSEVCKTRQLLFTCSEWLHKVNPAVFNSSGVAQSLGDLWAHFDHSRGGLIDRRALEGMPYEQKRILQTQLLITSIAPALPIPREFGLKVGNFYSKQDFFTGILGAPQVPFFIFGGLTGNRVANYLFDRSDCDIQFVPCRTKLKGRIFGVDHGSLGATYMGVRSDEIKSYRKEYGFYDGKAR